MIKDFKAAVREFKNAESVILRGLYQVMKVLWRLSRILFDANHRSVFITRLSSGSNVHQLVNYTQPDRYPDIFQAIAEHFDENREVKLLSFGCSTGEEVFSLRKYLPNAHLVGVDINRRNIRVANSSSKKDRRMVFHFSDGVFILDKGPYDAVLCLAVLQRTENRHPETVDSSEIYPFDRFDSQVSVLDSLVKLGGLLVIDHADYRFEDASVAAKYVPLENAPGIRRNRPIFYRNNKKSNESHFNPRMFRKTSPGG